MRDKRGLVILLLLALSTLSLGVSREYHFVKLLKTWSEAQSYCRENFSDLATIETVEDVAKVKRIIESTKDFIWIGLHKDTKKSWRWSTDNTYLYGDGNMAFGEWFSFTNQAVGRCVEIFGGQLYDRNCGVLQNSVCYDESTNKYIPVPVPKTWSSARSYCREKYTDLTSMRSQKEKEAIMSVIDQSHWWIGLSRAPWMWSDRSDSSLRLWGPNEPHPDGSEYCVSAYRLGWADISCYRKFPFICSVPQKKMFKVALKAEGSLDLNDPTVRAAVLKNIEKRLKEDGIHHKFRLSWRKQPNGKFFIKEEEQ